MGISFSILSNKKQKPKKVLLDLVSAAYQSKLRFYINKVDEINVSGKKELIPNSFTIENNGKEETPMIFHFLPFNEQIPIPTKYQSYNDINGNLKTIEGIFDFVSSEDTDVRMAYDLAYFYLKKNKNHLIDIEFIFGWEEIKAIRKNGFNERWCWLSSQ